MGKIEKRELLDDVNSRFRYGLAIQRERFKAAKDGTGYNNYDLMADSLENMKADLKAKIMKNGNPLVLKRIERILNWYRTKESRHVKNTPDGPMVVFPASIHLKINKNLTIAYELLVEQMDTLNLL